MSFETYRSQERQAKLFVDGTTKLKNVGVHHYGLACDIVRSVDGKPSWDGDFSIIGRLAKKHGLVWGGDWKTFPDAYHVQRCRMADQKALFAGTWYPSETYDPTARAETAPIRTDPDPDPDRTLEQPISEIKTLIVEKPEE